MKIPFNVAQARIQKLKALNTALKNLVQRTRLKSYLFLFLFLILVIVFRKTFVTIFTILMMVLLAALVALHKRFTIVSLGIELYTFFAIVLTYAYGPLVASIATIAMIALGDFLSVREPVYTLAKFAVYPLLCLLAYFLSGYNIVVIGMILAVIMNLVFFFVWGFLSQFSFFWGPVTILINLAVNYFLFARFGEPLVRLLGG
ncbi:MAG: hypothetical protein Q7R76_04840 [Candidatus Woesearchaeota archaeon]|nr:hypothetical protein [Candidatus Woesearchaeota archaeon]